MIERALFSAVFVLAVASACASSQPASSPPAQEPAPVTLPPAPIETTSNAPQESDAGLAPDTSVTPDAGTGISDMDAGPGAGAKGGASGGASTACKTDADCVPAECCHPKTCVAKGSAPNCSDMMCTKECRGGTMDCGGGCFCQQGQCAARLGRP